MEDGQHHPNVLKNWRFPSGPDMEKPVLKELREAAAHCGLPAERIEDLVSAAAEACLNAAEHGNRWKSETYVTVRMCTKGTDIHVRVYDEGKGAEVPLQARRSANILAGNPRGWGLPLMVDLSDELRFGRDASGFYTELCFRNQERGNE